MKVKDALATFLILAAICAGSYALLYGIAAARGGDNPHGDGRCVPADCPPAEPSGLP